MNLKIICINNEGEEKFLTVGKEYTASYYTPHLKMKMGGAYFICADDNKWSLLFYIYFMIYLKMYEDYTEPLFEELPKYNYRDIDRNTYIKMSDYPYKKDLIKYIISILPSIFGHNDFLTKTYARNMFDIVERKHLPFSISLRVTDEDFFIVKLTYYCLEAVYLYWKCDSLRGFIALLKHLISKPVKYEDFVGKNRLKNPYRDVDFDTEYNFTYTEEQLKELVKKLDISDVFSVKLGKLEDLSWDLNIGDMLFFNIRYVPSINCFMIVFTKSDLQGKKSILSATCFTEAGLYYFLEREYQNLEGLYAV